MKKGMIGSHLIRWPKGPGLKHWDCHPHDHHFLEDTLSYFPTGFRYGLGRNYSRLFNLKGRREANLYMLRLSTFAKKQPLKLTLNDEQIRDLAKAKARACRRIARATAQPAKLESISKYINSEGFDPPNGITTTGVIKRAESKSWWKRNLRARHAECVERAAIKGNIVNRHQAIYVSDETLYSRRQQRLRNRSVLEELVAINELGEEFFLSEVVDKSTSNPFIRRSELMVRLRGFELISNELAYAGVFYTLTCPSKMHRSLSRNGEPNPNYCGFNPRESNDYLNNVWRRIRAKLHREELKPFGIRVCEPQHDATPHWHFLLFIPKEQLKKVTDIFSHYALVEDGSEIGASKHRFKVKIIDSSKGSATGYIAKYISKNIDGFGLDTDLYGKPADSSAERVRAWASVWRIRQFQFFGSPPVTIWRELRRLNASEQTGLLKKLTQAADTGDWGAFVKLMGGPGCRREDQPASLFTENSNKKNRYGEPSPEKLLGILHDDELVLSRPHTWEIKQGPSKITEPLASIDPYKRPSRYDLLSPKSLMGIESRNSKHDRRSCITLEYCQ